VSGNYEGLGDLIDAIRDIEDRVKAAGVKLPDPPPGRIRVKFGSRTYGLNVKQAEDLALSLLRQVEKARAAITGEGET
jgi:hypothetical protein